MTRTTTEPTTTEPTGRTGRGGLSVRTRITVAVAVLVGLALTGAGLVVYALESARIDKGISEEVEQEMREFANLQGGNDPETAEPFTSVERLMRVFLQRNVPDTPEVLIGYWDGGFRLTSSGTRSEELRADPDLRQAIEDRLESGGGDETIQTVQGDVLVSVQPVRDDTTTGAFVLTTFLAVEYAELNRMIQTYAIISLLSLGLVTAVAAWQAGRLLQPVRVLRETAQEITETDLSRRIPETGNDDITALTRTVNEMLGRLDDAFSGQREFLDDAGHELKTPLTIIRGHMEVLDSADPVDVEGTKDLLLDEIDRMSRLVQDLMLLAKTDRPDFFVFAPVNVAPFTERTLDKCRALGERDWKVDESAQFMAELDEQRITQALLQLAQNAVKHTEPADRIAIGSQVDAEHGLRLWVRDTGAGVRDEDKAMIFERFGRVDVPAGDDGFGLGLSIVRAIAVGHGGTATVEDGVPQGARFVLTLPITRTLRRGGEGWHES